MFPPFPSVRSSCEEQGVSGHGRSAVHIAVVVRRPFFVARIIVQGMFGFCRRFNSLGARDFPQKEADSTDRVQTSYSNRKNF